jgi:hypothetical protein
MTETPRIEYEATDFEVFLERPLGLIVIEIATADPDKKIAVQMRRSVFDGLCERIAKARSAEDKRAHRQ